MELLPAHRTAMREFDARVRAVPDWDGPTACADWSARDLLNHLVSEQWWVPHLLAGETLEQVGDRYDGDLIGSDPLGAWSRASARSRKAWDEADITGEVHVTGGVIPTEDYGWQMTLDLAVHAWDLARGAGGDERLHPDLAQQLHDVFAPQVADFQGLGLFDPPQPVPEDADAQTRLLALLGRRA